MKEYIVWLHGKQAATWSMIAALTVADALRLYAARHGIPLASCRAYRRGFA